MSRDYIDEAASNTGKTTATPHLAHTTYCQVHASSTLRQVLRELPPVLGLIARGPEAKTSRRNPTSTILHLIYRSRVSPWWLRALVQIPALNTLPGHLWRIDQLLLKGVFNYQFFLGNKPEHPAKLAEVNAMLACNWIVKWAGHANFFLGSSALPIFSHNATDFREKWSCYKRP